MISNNYADVPAVVGTSAPEVLLSVRAVVVLQLVLGLVLVAVLMAAVGAVVGEIKTGVWAAVMSEPGVAVKVVVLAVDSAEILDSFSNYVNANYLLSLIVDVLLVGGSVKYINCDLRHGYRV